MQKLLYYPMKRKLTNAFGKVFLTIEINTSLKQVHVTWEGYLSESNIKAGGLAIMDTLKEYGFSCVLNNMLAVLGPIRATEWAATEWAPAIAEAGLKYMALVNAPDAIAHADVSYFHQRQAHFKTEVFNDLHTASDWLHVQCQPVLADQHK